MKKLLLSLFIFAMLVATTMVVSAVQTEFVFDSAEAVEAWYNEDSQEVSNSIDVSFDEDAKMMKIVVEGSDPYLNHVFLNGETFDAFDYPYAKIYVASFSEESSLAEIHFETQINSMTGATRITFNFDGTGVFQSHIIPMSTNPLWDGQVKNFRYDLVQSDYGYNNETFYIGYISFFKTYEEAEAYNPFEGAEPPVVSGTDKEEASFGWKNPGDGSPIIWALDSEEAAGYYLNEFYTGCKWTFDDGCLKLVAIAEYPYTKHNLPKADRFDADDYPIVKLRILNKTDAMEGRVYFMTDYSQEGEYAAGFAFESSEWTDVILDLSALAGWTGTVYNFRIDPIVGAAEDDQSYIEYIAFFSSYEEAEAYEFTTSYVDTEANDKAEDLKTLGLFIGTENGFELDRAPTRIEALVMLIRLLGVESDAKNGTWSHPFTDVPDWADPYVGYAYEKGLTAGVSDTLFGTDELSNAAQYLTFVLRALGYSDADGDFVWNQSHEKAAEIGLIFAASDYPDVENGEFLRANTVIISYSALSVNMKDTKTSLVSSLIDKGAVDADLVDQIFAE